jgi:hypothetical protein
MGLLDTEAAHQERQRTEAPLLTRVQQMTHLTGVKGEQRARHGGSRGPPDGG